jgi:hypothetical protein
MNPRMSDAAWRWFVALDGGELDGLLGAAGLLRFSWPSRALTHTYFDGVSGGHNPSLAPSGKLLLLGNFSQQLLLVDTATMKEVARQTTMSIEECDYRLRSTTHYLWWDDKTFLCAVGDHLYRCSVDDLKNPERIGPHRLWNVHEMRWSNDRRFVIMGDLGPETAGARQVGVFDMQTKRATLVRLPGTVWHVATHAEKNLGYAATYSFASEDDDYIEWSPSYTREYLFEIDLTNGKVVRSWSSKAEFPIHLNSDLEIYDKDGERKLYVASGGSHTVVEVDLGDFTTTRTVVVTPRWWTRFTHIRQLERNLRGAFLRRNVLSSTNEILQTYEVTGKRYFDGIYCVRASPDGKYLVAGNRGYNYIRVMDRKSLETVFHQQLPTLPGGLHLGMHHSELCAGEG